MLHLSVVRSSGLRRRAESIKSKGNWCTGAAMTLLRCVWSLLRLLLRDRGCDAGVSLFIKALHMDFFATEDGAKMEQRWSKDRAYGDKGGGEALS
jgi:hypothetical protein